MPWNGQNGGRGGSGGQNPWNRGGGKKGGGNDGGAGGPLPPDFNDWMRQAKEKLGSGMPGGGGVGKRGIILVGMVAVLLWAATGFYKVDQNEQGLLMFFGAYKATVGPGPGFYWPSPIGSVIKSKVTEEKTTEIGFSSYNAVTPDSFYSSRSKTSSRPRDEGREGLMLTKDENIVDVAFSVFWKIGNAKEFQFNIKDPENTVRVAAESVMRDVVGQTEIQQALTSDRERIEADVRGRLQKLMDDYEAGVQINRVQLLKVDPPPSVIDAFNDVQRAKADQARLINEATATRNSIVPQARGEAARITQEAEAEKKRTIDLSKGEADRFLSVYTAYKLAKDITVKRMYIETMEEVLRGSSNVIIDPQARQGQGVIPFLPLPGLTGGNRPAATPAPKTGGAQ